MNRILIIEDDPALCADLSELVRRRGYACLAAHRGDTGLELACSDAAELILLDVKLPGLDGFEVLRRLRAAHRPTPVIMLTACGAEEERIRGLRHGADDYLSKPFNPTELELRIYAVLRRVRRPGPAEVRPGVLVVDALRLERASQSATVDGRPVTLTPLQFRLLWQLVAQRGEALSKPYLYRCVLEREFSRYDRSLDMHISRIRRRLGETGLGADRLQTQHGKGYVFT